jgi:hypothetical protein
LTAAVRVTPDKEFMAAPQIKRKKKKHGQSLIRKYWLLVPVLLGVGMIGWIATGPRWSRARINRPGRKTLVGYMADTQTMRQEYVHYYGKPLHNAEIEGGFDQASERMGAGDYSNALGLLEQVSKTAAVPVVFNNLGVLYAELNDRARSINAFREALARDIDYRPVRLNLARMKDVIALGADPVTHEVESNNSGTLANRITPGKAVEAEIAVAVDDVDYFRVTTPPAPRDRISIEITNGSKTLVPVLRVFTEEGRITDWNKITREAGANLQQTIDPPPNTTLQLEISGNDTSAGAYTLLVRPLKAFDTYEPNDDIFNAPPITVGSTIAANIMDAKDTDFYSFVSPRTGTVSIVIANRSTTLIPALSTFLPDKRSSGFGPDVRTPGLNLRHTMDVRENQTYFIQVWSQANTAGEYSLIVE